MARNYDAFAGHEPGVLHQPLLIWMSDHSGTR